MAEPLRRSEGAARAPDPEVQRALADGDAAFLRGDLAAAHAAYAAAHRHDANEPAALSRYGLTLTLVARDELKGQAFCEEAVRRGEDGGDALWRLARVYLATYQKERGVRAVLRGLDVAPDHEGLRELLLTLGVRRPPVLPFLRRGNPLNVYLGKLRHRLAPPSWSDTR